VGLPTEYVESVPNELKRLLPAKTESEYRIIEHANYDELASNVSNTVSVNILSTN